MGKSVSSYSELQVAIADTVALQTLAGTLHVRWDTESSATTFGQLPFFIEFLTISGLFKSWVDDCPLAYSSPNASSPIDILGTWLLSILAGHKRYAHIAAIRADGVNPALLGMSKVVGDDTLRRALLNIPEQDGIQWLQKHLIQSALGLCTLPWILDVDTTVKPLYGHQEGAVVGYNPKKPGRPSHAYHTYQIGMSSAWMSRQAT